MMYGGDYMSVASLVLGIIALVLSLIPAIDIGGIILAIIAIILGAIGRKREPNANLGTAGMVCGIIALALGVVTLVACSALLNKAATDVAKTQYR